MCLASVCYKRAVMANASKMWLLLLGVVACGDDSGGVMGGSTGGSDTDPPGQTTATTTDGPGTSTPMGSTSDASSTTTDEPSTTAADESSTGSSVDEGVPMFAALGQGGRRLVSCDDGQTWVAEQVIEMNDDDHGPYSSRDVAWGGGTFLLGMGWGNPARIARSDDGIDWTETFPPSDYVEMRGLSGIAFGAGRFVAVVGADSWTSDDGGESWTLAGQLPTGGNIRVVTYSPGGSGSYYAVEDGGLIYQSADGASWSAPLPTQGSCDGGNLSRRGGIADRDGVVVLVTDVGNVCRSDDGGASFTHHTIDTVTGDVLVRSDVIATHEGFYTAGRNVGWHSADGTTWAPTQFTVDGDDIATLAHSSETGTLVGIAWNGDDFYRSTDGGRSWVRAQAPAGNDTNQAEFGYVTASDTCPG